MTETATEVKEQAQEKLGQAQEKAEQLAQNASGRARTEVDQRSTQIGQRVSAAAGDIRSVSQQLREQGKDQPARLTDQAAQHVERAGIWLRDSDSDKLLSDIEEFGRKQPWALALGGLALGVAASRFLKASSTQRYRQRQRPAPALPRAQGSSFGSNGHHSSNGIRRPETAITGLRGGSPSNGGGHV